MAKNISTSFSIDLGAVVNNSIVAVRGIRRAEQARKEAEFQRAIANGLSYEEQLKMRKDQLEKEKVSVLSDPEYIANLEKSIADTNRLNRFNKYRTRYAETLGEMSSGKINEEEYLGVLKNQLNNVDDPELRLEIQNDIAKGEAQLKTYKDTILSNQVRKAKYDGTTTALNDAVSRVNVARAQALINNNEDEVTAYDETLSALNSQLSTVKIQDSITDFQVKSSTRGVKPVEKLNFMNAQIQDADPSVPIKIGDKNYASAQQFWSLERDNFLAGTSQVFGNFFDELNNDVKNNIAVNATKFGYPTQSVLDETFSTFNDLRSKPEIAPFLNRLDITQANVMGSAVDQLAKTINAVGSNNLTFQEADIQLQNISTKYGVDVSGYRLQLDEMVRNQLIRDKNEGVKSDFAVPDVNIALPTINPNPTTPGATPAVTAPTGARIIKSGDTLSGIAKEAGISLAQLLELNPQYRTNPNIIKPGQSVALPGAAPAPIPVPGATPAPTPITPIAAPTTPSPTPVAPTGAREGDNVPGKGILQPDGTYRAATIPTYQAPTPAPTPAPTATTPAPTVSPTPAPTYEQPLPASKLSMEELAQRAGVDISRVIKNPDGEGYIIN